MGHGTRTQPSQPFLSKEELIRGVVAQNLPNRRGSLLGPMPEMPEISITQARRSDASRTRQKPKEPLNLARASLLFAQSGNPESDPGSPWWQPRSVTASQLLGHVAWHLIFLRWSQKLRLKLPAGQKTAGLILVILTVYVVLFCHPQIFHTLWALFWLQVNETLSCVQRFSLKPFQAKPWGSQARLPLVWPLNGIPRKLSSESLEDLLRPIHGWDLKPE